MLFTAGRHCASFARCCPARYPITFFRDIVRWFNDTSIIFIKVNVANNAVGQGPVYLNLVYKIRANRWNTKAASVVPRTKQPRRASPVKRCATNHNP